LAARIRPHLELRFGSSLDNPALLGHSITHFGETHHLVHPQSQIRNSYAAPATDPSVRNGIPINVSTCRAPASFLPVVHNVMFLPCWNCTWSALTSGKTVCSLRPI